MTTVTVSRDTHRKLKKLKDMEGADSFDELLRQVSEEKLDIPSSEEMFGCADLQNKDDIRERKDRIDRYRSDES